MKKDTQLTGGFMRRFQVFALLSAFAITSAALVLTQRVSAQDRPCLADVQRLCKDLAPDNRNGMMQCLKDHEADLSDACKARLQTFAHEPCAQDAMTLCSTVEQGNKRAMVHCLREHDAELSASCKARLNEFWARML